MSQLKNGKVPLLLIHLNEGSHIDKKDSRLIQMMVLQELATFLKGARLVLALILGQIKIKVSFRALGGGLEPFKEFILEFFGFKAKLVLVTKLGSVRFFVQIKDIWGVKCVEYIWGN